MTIQRPDLARTTLSVLFIGALIAGSLWILSPFLAAFVWATMIVVATWPMMRRVESAFGGRRAPAVAVMTLGLLAILMVPLAVALQAILEHADDLVALLGKPSDMRGSPPRRSGSARFRWRATGHRKHGTTWPARAWQTSRSGPDHTLAPPPRGSGGRRAASRWYWCSSC